jgi:hypothetical protein
MILGQSIFDAVLDRLKEEIDETSSPEGFGVDPPSIAVRGLNPGFISALNSTPSAAGSERLQDAYFAFSDDAPPTPSDAEHDLETRFARLTPQEIAEDMGLTSGADAARLHALRREFARTNHPDRVPDAWRDAATVRMKIANLLIDEALKRVNRSA